MHSFRTALFLAAIAILSLGLTACAGVKTASRTLAAPPKAEAFRSELKKELSTVNVTVEMSAKELSETLNRVAPRELYHGSTRTSGVSATVTRNGAIRATFADHNVHLVVPVSFSLSCAGLATPPVNTSLKFRVGLKVSPDWKLDPQFHFSGFTDALPESIGLGLLSVKPRSLAEGLTQPLQRALSELVAGKLNEKFPLKAQVAKAWDEAQKPILLDKKYGAWLVLTPQEVMLYPLHAQGETLKATVGLSSFAEVVVGPEPARRQPVPLPRLTSGTSPDRSFRLAVNTDLFYNEVQNLAAPLLIGKEFVSDGRSVVLKDLSIYGNGERLVIKVATAGALDGVIYLTCRPVYNAQSKLLTMEDVEFDLDSRSFLVQAADWFLHGAFRETLQEKLKMDLTPRLMEAREMAGKSVAKVKLGDDLFLNGMVKDMRLGDVLVRQDRISLRVYLEGESSVTFH